MMTEEQIIADQQQKIEENANRVRAAKIGALQNEFEQLGRAKDVIDVFCERITSGADIYITQLKRFMEGMTVNARQLPFDLTSSTAISFYFKDRLIGQLPKLAAAIITPQRWGMNPVEIPDTLQALNDRLDLRKKQLADFLKT